MLVWIIAGVAAVSSAAGMSEGAYAPIPGHEVAAGTPVELVRQDLPKEGRRVTVPTAEGGTLQTIEWRRDVVVRARPVSGTALGPAETQALKTMQVSCPLGGEPRDLAEAVERNGTWVLTFGCAWLQGVNGP